MKTKTTRENKQLKIHNFSNRVISTFISPWRNLCFCTFCILSYYYSRTYL